MRWTAITSAIISVLVGRLLCPGPTCISFGQPSGETRYFTGKQLVETWRAYKKCNQLARFEGEDCAQSLLYRYYIEGAYDAYGGRGPAGVTLVQLEAVGGNYLDSDPEAWNENAAVLVDKAIRKGVKSEAFTGGACFIRGKDLIELFRKHRQCREDPKGEGCALDLATEAVQYPAAAYDSLSAQGLLPNCDIQNCKKDVESITLKFLENHPGKWHLAGGVVILDALKEVPPPPKQ